MQTLTSHIAILGIKEHTCREGRPNKISTPTVGKNVDLYIQILIPCDALKEIDTTILENQTLPSTSYIFKIQSLEYPRLNYPQICSFLKI